MPPGPVSCVGGTKYPHCIVLYCTHITNMLHCKYLFGRPSPQPIAAVSAAKMKNVNTRNQSWTHTHISGGSNKVEE